MASGPTSDELLEITNSFEILDSEELLVNEDEMYFRQCSPSDAFWDSERNEPSYKLFQPHPITDEGKLSGTRSTKCSPARAYEERLKMTELLGRGGTRGTWQISVQHIQRCGFRAIDDSALVTPPPTGHTYLDMRALNHLPDEMSKREKKNYAKRIQGYLANVSVQAYPPRTLFDELESDSDLAA